MDSRNTHSDDLVFTDPGAISCVLAAGDTSDLAELRAWCAGLAEDAYGQVFIETSAVTQIETLDAPPGVGVTWICRDRNPLCAERCLRAGDALASAVDGWIDEWLRADSSTGRNVTLWTGARSNTAMCDYWDRLEAEFAAEREQRSAITADITADA